MRALVRSYNEGAGIDVLTVVDYTDSESRDLILEVVARDGQTLTMELAAPSCACARTRARRARRMAAGGGSRSVSR